MAIETCINVDLWTAPHLSRSTSAAQHVVVEISLFVRRCFCNAYLPLPSYQCLIRLKTRLLPDFAGIFLAKSKARCLEVVVFSDS